MTFEERKVYEFFLVDVSARKLPSGIKTCLVWKATETGDVVTELYTMTPDGQPGKKLQELLSRLNITLSQVRRNMTMYAEVQRFIPSSKLEVTEWSLAYCTIQPFGVTHDQISESDRSKIKFRMKQVNNISELRAKLDQSDKHLIPVLNAMIASGEIVDKAGAR